MELFQVPLPLAEDEVNASITCMWPSCGKYRQPRSIYCPHHQVTAEWIAAEPERRKRRAKLLRDTRRLKEQLLANSPLAVKQPQPSSTDPLWQKGRAWPQPAPLPETHPSRTTPHAVVNPVTKSAAILELPEPNYRTAVGKG
jgi:hypothetical protein